MSLAREAGVSRQHVARLLSGSMDPRRQAIAKIVSALRRLTLEDVRPEEVFDLYVEAERSRRKVYAQANNGGSSRGKAQDFVAAILRLPVAERASALARARYIPFATVARELVIAARRSTPSTAAEAVALADLAILALHRVKRDSEERAHINGCALLVAGNGLRHLGRYGDAFAKLNAAEEELSGTSRSASELGQVWYARSIVAWKRGAAEDALRDARRARTMFDLLGDERRGAYTYMVEGGVRFESGEPARARDLFLSVLRPLEDAADRRTLALAWANLGAAEAELGNVSAAKTYLARAEPVLASFRMKADVIRARWTSAYLIAKHESPTEGVSLLRAAIDAFEKERLPIDAGFARLDLVEILLETPGGAGEARELCVQLIDLFRSADAPSAAQKAFEYLAAAAKQGRASPRLARYVRQYAKAARIGVELEFRPRAAA
jgi:tetratricopeptide (TPR) repeat protein